MLLRRAWDSRVRTWSSRFPFVLAGLVALWVYFLLVKTDFGNKSWLLVYADLPPGQQPLDWSTRINILLGAAKGLEYLHSKAPPVINRDVKCENILLGEGYHPKLSDFGLARLGPTGDNTHVSTRVMDFFSCENARVTDEHILDKHLLFRAC